MTGSKFHLQIMAILLIALALPALGISPTEIMPLDQVKPGMKGIGYTVFKNDIITTFDVEIIDVVYGNVSQDAIILGSISGGPDGITEITSGIQGMSGSPVYIDGRLIGAISSAFPWSLYPIHGITPIEEMLQILDKETQMTGANTAMTTFWRDMQLDKTPQELAQVISTRIANMLGSGDDSALPLAFSASGLSTSVVNELKGNLRMPLTSRSAPSTGGDLPLVDDFEPKPGSAVGALFISGDALMAAIGTLTYVSEEGNILAFGHNMGGWGEMEFPLISASVHTVIPRYSIGFKHASPQKVIGIITQDRTPGIAGRLGVFPEMVHIEIKLKGADSSTKSFHYKVARHQVFTPWLLMLLIKSTIHKNARSVGFMSVKYHLEATIEQQKQRLQIDDHIVEGDASAVAVCMVKPIIELYANPFKPVKLNSVKIELEVKEKKEILRLNRCYLDASAKKAGSTVMLNMELLGYDGKQIIRRLPVALPCKLKPGNIMIGIMDSQNYQAWRQRNHCGDLDVQDLPDLIEDINQRPSSDNLLIVLFKERTSLSIKGLSHPLLPTSLLSVMSQGSKDTPQQPFRYQVLSAIQKVELPGAVFGASTLELEVIE